MKSCESNDESDVMCKKMGREIHKDIPKKSKNYYETILNVAFFIFFTI